MERAKQVFECYTKWEDWINGMWRPTDGSERDFEIARRAAALLSDPDKCGAAMLRVVNEWPIATKINLTNYGQNRRAWLGQAACCIELGIPEHLTRLGWNTSMLGCDREAANAIAEHVIYNWEREYVFESRICQNGQLMLTF